MAEFFDLFPKILYDISAGKSKPTTFDYPTNILFRLRIVRDVLTNAAAYYEYLVKESDTPDILAFNIYGSSEAHWVILFANDMIDPQYDWPLNSRDFRKYIINKYGSIETAKTTIHHYEKIILREESLTGITTESRFLVNEEQITNNNMDVPYDTYENLTDTQNVETINMGNGRTVVQITSRNAVSNYDYEEQLNENKRAIKIIKPEFYPRIVDELNTITRETNPRYLRRLV
jgi:hypothetical protein